MKPMYQAGIRIILLLLLVASYSCRESQIPENEQPRVQIAVSALEVNFGTLIAGDTVEKSIQITNSFSFGRTLTGTIKISGVGFSIVSGGEPFNLAPGESRTIMIRLTSANAPAYSGSLIVTHTGLNVTSPLSIPLRGSVDIVNSVGIVVSPTSVDFGPVVVGQSSTQNVTITNPSTSNLNLNGTISLIGTGYSLVSGSGAFNLAPGETRTVAVKGAPTSSGKFTGTLTINHNAVAPSSPVRVSLTGTGQPAPPPDIAVSPDGIDFGTLQVGQSPTQTLTISNPAGSPSPLNVSVSLDFGSTGFQVVSGSGSYTLSPGQSKTVSIKFSASSKGSYTGSVRISHNAGNATNPILVPLQGVKVSSIIISISTTSMDFGTVLIGDYLEQHLTIANPTNSTGSLSGSLEISGTGFFITSGVSSFSLVPGQSMSVTIRFIPQASTHYAATLLVYHNATTASSPISVFLSGSGQWKLSVAVSPTSLNFGTVILGQSADQSFTFSNAPISSQTLTGTVVFGPIGAGFSIIEGGGSYSLSPGQSKTVKVRFTPGIADYYGGVVELWHNAQNAYNPLSIQLQGQGKSPTIGIAISPSSIDFGSIAVGQMLDRTVTVTCPSSSTGILTGTISVSGTGFSLVGGSSTFSLSPGQSTTATVRFAPLMNAYYSGSVKIVHNATDTFSPSSLVLSGSGR